ncbi:MAG: NlpC/P60 family protein [Parvibaculaceae bacterium]
MSKTSHLDKRLNPYRDDLAASYLRGEVEADRFADSSDFQVTAPRASLLRRPEDAAPMDTELLFGERFRVYETKGEWCWGQAAHDDYVGYVRKAALGSPQGEPTHRVVALRTFRYPSADIKTRPVLPLSMNAKLSVVAASGKFAEIAGGGFVIAAHLSKIDAYVSDFVAVAEEFLGVPYLWGGRDARGIDCSGLVQMSLERSGIACLRDTDLQEATLGSALPDPSDLSGLQRGDLVFWRGHVGIMTDGETLLHANATHMRVVTEPLEEAVHRIEKSDGPVNSIRRL